MGTARQVADQIQHQIEARMAPAATHAGTLVGTEAELCDRHGVSLGTLRRAVRILEQREVAVMRRGANGGLYVATPSIDATANVITAQWERAGAARQTIMRDAMALRGLVLRCAHERMTLAQARNIAELHARCRALDDPIAISAFATRREHAIGRLTGNPVIELGHAVTMRYQRQTYPFEVLAQDDGAFVKFTASLVDEKISALIRGDVDAAIQASNDYVTAYLEKLGTFEHGKDRLQRAPEPSDSASLPMLVSRAVLRDIRKRGWQAGEFLGREPELLARYQVSRSTWRQALSILFEYSAVESRRGGAGGIYVAPFNPAVAREAAASWLSRRGSTAAHGMELLAAIAPHHVFAAWNAGLGAPAARALVPAPPLDCGALLGQVLDRETSPLLGLAAIAVPREVLYAPSAIEIAEFSPLPLRDDLIKRAILGHFEAQCEAARQTPGAGLAPLPVAS